MEHTKTYYHRRLPHYQPPYATFFVTFRLADSLPREVIIQLQEEQSEARRMLQRIKDETKRKQEIAKQHKRYFGKFDEYLDKASEGPFWLRDERIAQLVAGAIHFRDGKEYDLIAYCIMPNHVHMVFDVGRTSVRQTVTQRTEVRTTTPAPYFEFAVTKILRELKGSTAREANKILGRSGSFWQHESYDHVVRNAKELDRIISYVINNPVSAGLVKHWEECHKVIPSGEVDIL